MIKGKLKIRFEGNGFFRLLEPSLRRNVVDKIEQLQDLIDQGQRIVFFGGQGYQPGLIPNFRSSDGVYSHQLGRHFTAEQLVSRTMFECYPEDF